MSTIKEPWEKYPVSLVDYNALVTDGEAYRTRISSLAESIFGSTSEVLVVDEDRNSSELAIKSLRGEEDLETCLYADTAPQNRIMYSECNLLAIPRH